VPVLCAAVKPASDERTPDGGADADQQPDLEQLMTVRSSDHDDAVIITVRGDVDGLTAPRLRAAVAEAFDRLDGRPLVVDLTEVTLLGSPGLRILRDSADEAVHHRGMQPLRIVVDENRPVIRPIEIVGLDEVLALYHNVDHALAPGDLQP
jgi:anti-sigma B factor antagonist